MNQIILITWTSTKQNYKTFVGKGSFFLIAGWLTEVLAVVNLLLLTLNFLLCDGVWGGSRALIGLCEN